MSHYDQCVVEVQAPACRVQSGVTGDSTSRAVDLRFCINIDYIVVVLLLGLIFDTDSNDDFSEATLRTPLTPEATESRSALMLPA